MGARAIAALKKFQSDHALPVTGQLDGKTLDALNAPPPEPAGVQTQSPEKAVSVEKYEEADARELHIDFRASTRMIEVGDDGKLANLDMTIRKLAVGDTDIALTTDRVDIDPDDHSFGTISTRDFGIFRLQFDSGGGASLYLKPSQKEGLRALYHSAK
jgi:hypothetical protein